MSHTIDDKITCRLVYDEQTLIEHHSNDVKKVIKMNEEPFDHKVCFVVNYMDFESIVF